VSRSGRGRGLRRPRSDGVHHALDALNFSGVNDVRVGKQIVLELHDTDAKHAKEQVTQMCESLLANTVIEDYEIEIMA